MTQSQYATDAARWQAVRSNDEDARDAFVYAVRSTGVYCRPHCASRLPNRENVQFHDTAKEAERHGFRPCKKCRPGERSHRGFPDSVQRACELMQASPVPLSLGQLADAVGLSPSHFHRVFKKATGITPKAFEKALRTSRFQEALQAGKPIMEAIFLAGYSTVSRCYEDAPSSLGMTPSQYQSRGAGQQIRIGIAKSTLGYVGVAATNVGVCAIEIGDDERRVWATLKGRFQNADLEINDLGFADLVESVVRQVDGSHDPTEIRLDIHGTVFQQRVWDCLRSIPSGTTMTYGEIAERLGKPTAARAVARACAANAVAVLVPCHRVVGGDAKMHGYRWGVEKKRQLLDRESTAEIDSP